MYIKRHSPTTVAVIEKREIWDRRLKRKRFANVATECFCSDDIDKVERWIQEHQQKEH